MPEITIQTDVQRVKIFMNGILHLSFEMENYSHFQSWKNYTRKFVIEITMKEGPPLLAEYDDRALWTTIIEKLNGVL